MDNKFIFKRKKGFESDNEKIKQLDKEYKKIKFYPKDFNIKSFQFSIEEENNIDLIKEKTKISENKNINNNNINLNFNIQKVIVFEIGNKNNKEEDLTLKYLWNINDLIKKFYLNSFSLNEILKTIEINNLNKNNAIILYNNTDENIIEKKIDQLNTTSFQFFEILKEVLIINLKIGLNFLFLDENIINVKQINIIFFDDCKISTKGFKNNIDSNFKKFESYILTLDLNYFDTPIILLEFGKAIINFNKSI